MAVISAVIVRLVARGLQGLRSIAVPATGRRAVSSTCGFAVAATPLGPAAWDAGGGSLGAGGSAAAAPRLLVAARAARYAGVSLEALNPHPRCAGGCCPPAGISTASTGPTGPYDGPPSAYHDPCIAWALQALPYIAVAGAPGPPEREGDRSTPDSAQKFPACPVLLASERNQQQ